VRPDPRAFGRWVKERLERCGLKQSDLARETGYQRSGVSRFLAGKRRPTEEFLAWTLLALWEWDAFDHPAEAMDGAALLGMTPEEVARLIREKIVTARESKGHKFLEYLEGWNKPRVDPRAQGIRPPTAYVEREGILTRLRALLTEQKQEDTRKRVVLWGMGGVGKTTLAQAVALDETVLQLYRNGVLWAELGPQGKPGRWLRGWCRLLKVPLRGDESVWELSEQVRSTLSKPWLRFLIILDDVWRVEDVEPLLVDGPQSAVLLTMREKHLAQKLGIDDWVVEVDVMEEEEAERLVRRRLGTRWREEDTEQSRELIYLVDRLPLALELGAGVAKQRGWEYVLNRLREGGKTIDVLALSRAERREHSLRSTLDLSYENLPDRSRDVFDRLGMFTPGETFIVWDLVFCWQPQTMTWLAQAPGESVYGDVLEELGELVEASLVVEVEPGNRYRLHPLVGCYAAERLQQRADATELWHQYIEHALDVLTMGVSISEPGALPPFGRNRMLYEHWPHIERAWRKARSLWQERLGDELQPGLRAVHWAEVFGLLGCQVLWRWRDWEGIARWAKEAQELYRRGHRVAWKAEPDGQVWGMLLCWILDGRLKQGRADATGPLLESLRGVDFGGNSPAWEVRIRVREARLRMLAGEEEATRELTAWIAGEADTLLGRSDPALVLHTLAEIHELLGDSAARWGEAAEAERHWWQACRRVADLMAPGDEYGFDEWRLEQLVERIVRWRAEHGMWREAARAGRAWIQLRLGLGEDVEQPLIDVATWALKGEEEEIVAWALDRLWEFLKTGGYAYLEGATYTLQGLVLAEQGRKMEAGKFLEKARERYAADLQGGKMVEFLNEAIEAVKEGRRPSLPLQAREPPYSVPRDELDPTLTFDQWLGGCISILGQDMA